MNKAHQIVNMLLEGGAELLDYSPEDLQRYQQLKAERVQLQQQGRIMDRTTGELSKEWMLNWAEFEKVRNKYNGMPPKQLQGGI
jgi:hypothetical protein